MRSSSIRTTPIRMAAIALAGVLGVLLAGCTSSGQDVVVTVFTTPGAASAVTVPGGGSTGQDQAQASAPGTSTAAPSTLVLANGIRVAATPKFGSKDVGPGEPFSVTVFAGKIQKIQVKGDDGSTVAGKLSSDKATWNNGEQMRYGITYTVKGTAIASDKSTKDFTGKITTVDPTDTVRASFQRPIANGETVGIAAPIILTFFEPIQDKANAQRALKVTTSRGEVEGSWGWLQDEDVQGNGQKYSIVHFRPKEYWPANTEVHVEANLYGVNFGNGWGRENIAADFKIGRSQVVKADVASFRLYVFRDGKIVENYPVSYGKESEPGRNTVSGIHVVTEKYPEFKMCNPQWGYCNVPEKWAVRINNNGEFIHNNTFVEKNGLLGVANVSHGCINMGAADAEEYYKSAIYGDPVEVTGTGVKMTEADAIYDWKYSWSEWKQLSRLST
jgi:lipoprotein-anchoring transpeptidase ErfK/SrfK